MNYYEQAAEMLINQEYDQAKILIQNALTYMVQFNDGLNKKTEENTVYL